MKTITLNIPMEFKEALQYLLDGKCLGIKPGNNSSFIILCKPSWMNKESPDYILKWSGTDDYGIRSNQYLENWFPVVIDHRTLND